MRITLNLHIICCFKKIHYFFVNSDGLTLFVAVDMVDTDHMVVIMVDTADTVDMVDTADMVDTDTVDIEVVGMVTTVAGNDKVMFPFYFLSFV